MFLKGIQCYKPWTDFGIWDIEGNVRACCWSEIILGNINKNSIEEIWNGEKYQMLRRDTASGIFECNSQCPVLHRKGFLGSYFANAFNKETCDKKAAQKCQKCWENAELNRKEILQKKVVLNSKPRFFKLHVDNKCNLKCPMCHLDKDSPATLSDNFLEELKSYYPFIEGLGIWGGEPLFSSKARKILFEFNYTKFSCCRIGLVTNGILINKYISSLAKVNFGWVNISLDAATKRTYNKLRVGGSWEKVLRGINKLIELRNKQKQWFPITIDMVLQPDNYEEITQFIKLGHRLGVKVTFENLDTNTLWFSTSSNLKRSVKKQIRQGLNTAIKYDTLSAGIDLSILLDLCD